MPPSDPPKPGSGDLPKQAQPRARAGDRPPYVSRHGRRYRARVTALVEGVWRRVSLGLFATVAQAAREVERFLRQQ